MYFINRCQTPNGKTALYRTDWKTATAFHSSSLSSLMLKYRSSYEVLFGAMTCRKSRSCCFFKYFLVRYLRYRLEKGASALTRIFDFSRDTVTASPRFPVLPLTLMRSLKNFSRSETVRMVSSAGCWQSTVNFKSCFFPFTATFFFRPLIAITVDGRPLQA